MLCLKPWRFEGEIWNLRDKTGLSRSLVEPWRAGLCARVFDKLRLTAPLIYGFYNT
jgi:hypothetical protein